MPWTSDIDIILRMVYHSSWLYLPRRERLGPQQREHFFVSFTRDSHLCVVQYLHTYEEVTMKFWDTQAKAPSPLFTSYVQPHKPVTSQRIAHWIKNTLKEAGVDTNTFSANSVQAVVLSSFNITIAAGQGFLQILKYHWVGRGLHIADVLKEQGIDLQTILPSVYSKTWDKLCPGSSQCFKWTQY